MLPYGLARDTKDHFKRAKMCVLRNVLARVQEHGVWTQLCTSLLDCVLNCFCKIRLESHALRSLPMIGSLLLPELRYVK